MTKITSQNPAKPTCPALAAAVEAGPLVAGRGAAALARGDAARTRRAATAVRLDPVGPQLPPGIGDAGVVGCAHAVAVAAAVDLTGVSLEAREAAADVEVQAGASEVAAVGAGEQRAGYACEPGVAGAAVRLGRALERLLATGALQTSSTQHNSTAQHR